MVGNLKSSAFAGLTKTKYKTVFQSRIIATAIFLALILKAATGQQAPVNTTFTALSWDNAIQNIFYMDGKERIELIIPNGAPSKKYKYLVNTPLLFFRDGPLDAEGKPTRILVAETILRPSSPDPLLLFLKNTSGSPEYRIASLQTGFQNNTKDLYRLFNLSSYNLIAKFDEENISLEPGEDITFNSPDISEPNFGVMIALRTDPEETGDWKLVYKTFWPYREGRSSIVFITDREGRPGQINVRRFYVETHAPIQ